MLRTELVMVDGALMTTRMNIDLSPALISTLTHNGAGNHVYAYAFAFAKVDGAKGSLVTQATLVNNGQIGGSSGTQSYIDLPGPNFDSGQVYVVIQQATPENAGNLPAHIAAGTNGSGGNPGGVITPIDAKTLNYSYQLFEATLKGSPNDLGDISALNTFGFSATMEVSFSDGTSDHRGFRSSANDIFTAVGSAAVEPFNPNIFPTPNNRLGIGPASKTDDFPASDWTAYVNALANNNAVLNDIVIVTSFTGGTSLQAAPMLSEYGVQYDAPTDSFWLVPDFTHGATNTDWIKIPASVLRADIYTQSTDLEVHQGSKTGPDVTARGGGFTPNNAAGTVARDFVLGFDAGYWGGSGTSLNPLDTTLINLNHNNNWNANYAYNGKLNPDPGLVHYTNVLGSGPGTPGGNDRFYDPWAQAIQSNGNAYGWSFSDMVSNGGVNPQITLWDAKAGQQVKTINLTLYDNGETPPAGSFLTAPPVYVAPPTGGYKDATTSPTIPSGFGYASEIGFSFNFGVSTLGFMPYLDTPINFRFYAPHSAQAAADGFISLPITAPNGDWYNYYAETTAGPGGTGGTWSLNPNGEQAVGNFHLFNLPTTTDGSTSWYQLEFGAPGSQTIYNIYAESGTAQGVTHALTDLVVDRAVNLLVTPGTDNTPTYYSLSFAAGGNLTYDVANVPARALHDINADGFSDLIFQKSDGTVFAWEQNAVGTIAGGSGQIGTPDPTWHAKFVADFYGDGGSDILFQNSSTSTVHIWKQDGLHLETAGSIGTPGLQWQVKGAGDINGDGAADVIFQNSSTGDVFGWEQHGLSTIVGGAGTIGTPGTAWQVKGVADFNADGNADIVLQHSGTGDVAIYNLDGLFNTSTSIVGSPGTAWQIKGTGDVNGDGYADIIFQNGGSGDVHIWEMTPVVITGVVHDTILTSGTVGTPGTDWQVAGTGDFNGNGKTDIAFQKTSTGEIFEWQMDGLHIAQGISLGDPGTAWHLV